MSVWLCDYAIGSKTVIQEREQHCIKANESDVIIYDDAGLGIQNVLILGIKIRLLVKQDRNVILKLNEQILYRMIETWIGNVNY